MTLSDSMSSVGGDMYKTLVHSINAHECINVHFFSKYINMQFITTNNLICCYSCIGKHIFVCFFMKKVIIHAVGKTGLLAFPRKKAKTSRHIQHDPRYILYFYCLVLLFRFPNVCTEK